MRTIFILFALLSGALSAQTEQFTLDNGLKILVKEDHRAPIVVSMIWYNVGSADEPGGITGVSHALEHLMFKGTTDYPVGVFSKTMAGIGAQENAMTSNDYTAFYENTAASHLALSFKLEADRMQHLLLDKAEFGREIKVIQEERRLRTDNSPQALTFERFLATAHLASPYHHPVIGWMSDLKHMDVRDARAWYQRYYTPNNATLVVVGDVKAPAVYALAKQYFGAMGARALPVRAAQQEPPVLGKKTVLVKTPAQIPMLLLGYTVPSIKSAAPTDAATPYALEIISGLFSAGDSGRFNKQLVRGTQVASSADAYYNPYARYQTQFVLFGTPSKGHTVADLSAGILREINRLKDTPIAANELQRIKTQLIAQKTFQRDSIFTQATELGLLETVGLGWQTADQYVERIHAITPEQVQKTARRYFLDNGLTEAQLIPETTHRDK
ncbi:MAG TPA: peptidase M16 [Legionella sp.]|nr:peptidase M16 [Legionella sp.]